MTWFSLIAKNLGMFILNVLFLLSALSLFFFYKNMLFLHIVTVLSMILVLIKSYEKGIKSGIVCFSPIIAVMVISMIQDGTLDTNELSEIVLLVVPSFTVGLLADKQRRYAQQLKETSIATLKALAEITEARDQYTQGHSERVAQYAVATAKELSLSEKEIDLVEKAALLHDIGKIAVPDNILYKKEPLNDEEWKVMKKHPEYSHRILSQLTFLSPVLPSILYHHQRIDNQGYPQKDPKIPLPLVARILSAADAFDAITSDRPYRKGLSFKQALVELEKGSGSQFDPKVIEAFKGMINRMES